MTVLELIIDFIGSFLSMVLGDLLEKRYPKIVTFIYITIIILAIAFIVYKF